MATPEITKETLQYLANLARIKLDPDQEAKLLADMQNIVAYVSELQAIDTSGVEPMNGGTLLKGVFREDDGSSNTDRGAGKEQFPEAKDGYLKIPPVFGSKSN